MDLVTTIIVVLFVIFVLRGAWRGLSGELAPFVGLLAFIGTLWYGYPHLPSLLKQSFTTMDASACTFYAALIATIGACISYAIIAKLVRTIVGMIIPQPFNAIIGALVGGLKVVVIVSVIGGLLTVAQDRFRTLREQSEQNPFAAVVAQFWINRFNQFDWSQLNPQKPTTETFSTLEQSKPSSQEVRH